VTESVGNASLGGSPSEDFLTGGFTANTNVIYVSNLCAGKTQVCMICTAFKTILQLQTCTSGIHFNGHNIIKKILSNNTKN
jgi:hypothetical protein